jgi:hypothetical protein
MANPLSISDQAPAANATPIVITVLRRTSVELHLHQGRFPLRLVACRSNVPNCQNRFPQAGETPNASIALFMQPESSPIPQTLSHPMLFEDMARSQDTLDILSAMPDRAPEPPLRFKHAP